MLGAAAAFAVAGKYESKHVEDWKLHHTDVVDLRRSALRGVGEVTENGSKIKLRWYTLMTPQSIVHDLSEVRLAFLILNSKIRCTKKTLQKHVDTL